jgi:hypothetical protein
MILSKMTTIQREVYVATYGAYFAAKVHDHMKLGRGSPEVDDLDDYARDADSVACEAADRVPTP